MTPEALVASILKRRKAAASSLPTTLEQRIEENNRAYQLANGARATLKQLEADEQPDANHLDALEKARNVYDEHEAFRRRTDSRLKKAKHAMKDSEEAVQFWSAMGEGGWGTCSRMQNTYAQAEARVMPSRSSDVPSRRVDNDKTFILRV